MPAETLLEAGVKDTPASKARAVIQRSFSETEWEWLAEDAEFQKALLKVRELSDIERTCRLGLRRITEAVEGRTERPFPSRES